MQIAAANFYKVHTSSGAMTICGDTISSVKVQVVDLNKVMSVLEIQKSSNGRINKAMSNTDEVKVFAENDGTYYDWGKYNFNKEFNHYFELRKQEVKKRTADDDGVLTRSQSKRRNTNSGAETYPQTSADMALTTHYSGIKFRSRLEARTAVFMDSVGVQWKYEVFTCRFPEGLSKRTYTPDFFLPDQQMFVEIKPAFPHIDEIKACEMFVKTTGMPIVLLYGSTLGAPYRSSADDGGRYYAHAEVQRGMMWDIDGELIGGHVVWVMNETGAVELGAVRSTEDERWNNSTILNQLRMAATHSFAS